MKTEQFTYIGSTNALLTGILYIIGSVAFLRRPLTARGLNPSIEWAAAYMEGQVLARVQFWSFALASLLAIAVVIAVARRISDGRNELIQWVTVCAIIGFGFAAAHYLMVEANSSRLAVAYDQLDGPSRAAIEAMGIPTIDPHYWMVYGLPGLWMVVIHWHALRQKVLPRPLTVVGMGFGLFFLLVVVGRMSELDILFRISAALGGIVLGPLWFISMGLYLRKSQKSVEREES